MTFPVHYTLEQRREAQRLKMAKYRATHREYCKQKDNERYPKRQIKRHSLVFNDKCCKLCSISLATPIYGADKGTKVHCLSCSKDKKTITRLAMRKWRKKQTRKPKK